MACEHEVVASLVILLMWVYCSAQILRLGAEVRHAYADKHDSRVKPVSPEKLYARDEAISPHFNRVPLSAASTDPTL